MASQDAVKVEKGQRDDMELNLGGRVRSHDDLRLPILIDPPGTWGFPIDPSQNSLDFVEHGETGSTGTQGLQDLTLAQHVFFTHGTNTSPSCR